MGFDPADVGHIVLTHLDFDHAGGLDDFPNATVHMLEAERDAAFAQETWLDRQRFRPQQWSTLGNWRVYQAGEGDAWFGFNRVRCLEGLPKTSRSFRCLAKVEIFCAHDVAEFERLSGRSAEIPADRIVPRGRAGSVADSHALGD